MTVEPPSPSRRVRRVATAIAAVLAGVLGIAFAVVVLVARVRPSVVPDRYAPFLPVGWSSVTALVIVLLVANIVCAWLRPLSILVPLLVLVIGSSVVVDVPGLITRSAPASSAVPAVAESFVRAVLIAALVVVVGKVLLLRRFAGIAYAHAGGTRSAASALLPSQRRDLGQLEALVMSDPPTGKVVPVRGRQGEGKSFLLRQLLTTWAADNDKPAVAYVDVWQQQTEVDLQVSIIEALLSQPKALRRLRWLTRVPVTFHFARVLAHLQNSATVVKIKLEGKPAPGVEADLRPPRLNWQRLYERISNGHRTIVILDEVDRATPEVAQAALTLARRSVDIPGVTVLLPYVRELVRYKVFNPAVPALPDLASTMEAVVFDYASRDQERLARSWSAASAPLPPGPGGWAQQMLAWPDTDPWRTERLRRVLVDEFIAAPPAHRDYLQRMFEEKYLGPVGITLQSLQHDDICEVICSFRELRRNVVALCAGGMSPAERTELDRAMKRGFDHRPSATVNPPIRVLQGHLYAVFEAAATRRPDTGLAPDAVAALALVAADIASLAYRNPLEG